MNLDVKAKREIFKQAVEAIDPSQLIFIDESGVHCGMSRLYGRAIGKIVLRDTRHFIQDSELP